MQKICTKCNQEKFFSEFYKNKTTKDGMQGHCKVCFSSYYKTPEAMEKNRQRLKLRNIQNPEKTSAWHRKYYQSNRESILRKTKEYISIRPELKSEINKKYNAKPDVIERNKARNIERYAKNREHILSLSRKWAEENKDKKKAHVKIYQSKNPNILLANCAKRRARKLAATPKWANDFYIKEIYHISSLRTKITGIKYHVDHIIPLKSEIVCGLHNEFNLQVITSTQNMKKSNRVWPDMP